MHPQVRRSTAYTSAENAYLWIGYFLGVLNPRVHRGKIICQIDLEILSQTHLEIVLIYLEILLIQSSNLEHSVSYSFSHPFSHSLSSSFLFNSLFDPLRPLCFFRGRNFRKENIRLFDEKKPSNGELILKY